MSGEHDLRSASEVPEGRVRMPRKLRDTAANKLEMSTGVDHKEENLLQVNMKFKRC
jgi:hypothetical protein